LIRRARAISFLKETGFVIEHFWPRVSLGDSLPEPSVSSVSETAGLEWAWPLIAEPDAAFTDARKSSGLKLDS
jgi:hypothetical protein